LLGNFPENPNLKNLAVHLKCISHSLYQLSGKGLPSYIVPLILRCVEEVLACAVEENRMGSNSSEILQIYKTSAISITSNEIRQ